MIKCALLMAALLGASDVSQRTEALRGQKPREEFVIYFTWQPVEKWQVEIREYQFRPRTLPELPPGPWKLEGGPDAVVAQDRDVDRKRVGNGQVAQASPASGRVSHPSRRSSWIQLNWLSMATIRS